MGNGTREACKDERVRLAASLTLTQLVQPCLLHLLLLLWGATLAFPSELPLPGRGRQWLDLVFVFLVVCHVKGSTFKTQGLLNQEASAMVNKHESCVCPVPGPVFEA